MRAWQLPIPSFGACPAVAATAKADAVSWNNKRPLAEMPADLGVFECRVNQRQWACLCGRETRYTCESLGLAHARSPSAPSSVVKLSSLAATTPTGAARQELMPYWVPSRMGPVPLSRFTSDSPMPAKCLAPAAILSALSMPSDRPNHSSASLSQLALGSDSPSWLPALFLPAPEQGRFSGRRCR